MRRLILAAMALATCLFVLNGTARAGIDTIGSCDSPPYSLALPAIPATGVYVYQDDGLCYHLTAPMVVGSNYRSVLYGYGSSQWARIQLAGVATGEHVWFCDSASGDSTPTTGYNYAPCFKTQTSGHATRFDGAGGWMYYRYSVYIPGGWLPDPPACPDTTGATFTSCGTLSDDGKPNYRVLRFGVAITVNWPNGQSGSPCVTTFSGQQVVSNLVCPNYNGP
jgi:hypothetical protein